MCTDVTPADFGVSKKGKESFLQLLVNRDFRYDERLFALSPPRTVNLYRRFAFLAIEKRIFLIFFLSFSVYLFS